MAECTDDVSGHGYCRKHYERWKRNGTSDLVLPRQEPICTVDSCGRASASASLCGKHYARKLSTGNPARAARYPRDMAERFVEFTDRDGPIPAHMPDSGPCWVWNGATLHDYGRVSVENQSVMVHRWSYERHVGPIPDGLTIDHLCLNTRCANPGHLEPVTNAENARRMQAWRSGASHGSDAPTDATAGHRP